ncbi:MAG: hypothetical protein KAJ54_03560 [Candidatus Aenigmarchaeota archaeon]|nr:hypothetical protein [Candidatus Aenigmarchaeota archaeon]
MNENESVLDKVYGKLKNELGLPEDDQSKFKGGVHIQDTGYMEFSKVEDHLTDQGLLDAVANTIEGVYEHEGYTVKRKDNVLFTEKMDDKEKSYRIDMEVAQQKVKIRFMEDVEKQLKEYMKNH